MRLRLLSELVEAHEYQVVGGGEATREHGADGKA